MKEIIKGIALIVLTWVSYSASIIILLTSMINNDTYLIGVAIFVLIIAGRMEKRLEETIEEMKVK